MSFEHSQTVSTTAPPSAVWALWSDTSTWPTWDPSVVAVALDGPFEEGTTGTMTLAGPFEVPVVLAIVEPGARYLDQLTMGDLVIRIDHVVTAQPDGGSEVTVSTTIVGPGADDIGPMVTAEAPLALAALTAAAEAASA
ncbi:SRPBCC family protein [Nocardioides rubriscoriae]|uniref:SRPBCC family protein n=1 Tax=Nocardioides rubriscoriae TaxID=642762 RepID=UPI0011DF256F|nr:SRPBCC family protein [Nocardioides rubriscoriae]